MWCVIYYMHVYVVCALALAENKGCLGILLKHKKSTKREQSWVMGSCSFVLVWVLGLSSPSSKPLSSMSMSMYIVCRI